MNAIRRGLIAALLIFVAVSAHADGVTDFVINPNATYAINTPGSYRLTADVTMTANVAAIEMFVDSVTLDLNGHTITGLAGGTDDGIRGVFTHRMVVRNGVVRGFNGSGIVFVYQTDCELTDLVVEDCGVDGIFVDEGARITRVSARGNGQSGISVGSNAVIERCVATGNNSDGGFAGILAVSDSVVRDCTANSNLSGAFAGDSTGIKGGNGSTITGCTANYNNATGSGSAVGIDAGLRCVVTGNVCAYNTAADGEANSGQGISAGDGCTVSGNTCTNNGGSNGRGITASSGCRIEDNVCRLNYSPTNGSGEGIITGTLCSIRNNAVSDNHGAGAGGSYGIDGNAGCRIENNHCTNNVGGAASAGLAALSGSFIRGNTTLGNGGLSILLVGNGSLVLENMYKEAGGISSSGINIIETGDRENIAVPF